MKNLVFAFALLCSTSLVAQFSFNATSGNGIESATNTASGYYSTAMGFQTTASGGFSTAMGDGTQASGDISTTMGWNTNAQDFGTIATGIFNETDETPNPFEFSYQNTAFVIGNGGFDSNGNYLGTNHAQMPSKSYLTAQLPLQVTSPPLLLLAMVHS